MGSDSYCAICGVTIVGCQVGSGSARARRIRTKIVRIGQSVRAGRTSWDEINNARRRVTGTDPIIHDSDSEDDGRDIMDPECDYQIKNSYAPDVIGGHDTTWTETFVMVVYDPNIKALSKCFISNPGRYEDYGCATADGHPDHGDPLDLHLYEVYNPNEEPAYPCHRTCLPILARAITGTPDLSQLNMDTMYDVMREDLRKNGERDALDLDYGDISGRDQFWQSLPGEEFCVIDPCEVSVLDLDTIRGLVFEHMVRNQSEQTARIGNADTDPFSRISVDVILYMTAYMFGREILRLRRVSMAVRETTCDSTFWRRKVQREMCWLWETLPDLKAYEQRSSVDPEAEAIDWMRVYMLLDHITSSVWGMKGEYMSLANRRRIWHLCEEIGSLYHSRLPPPLVDSNSPETHSLSLQVPQVSHPKPDGTRKFSTMIKTWEEPLNTDMQLTLAWNDHDELAGISLHDLPESDVAKVTKINIPRGDWIKAVTLFILDMDITQARPIAVAGVRVHLSSGGMHDAGNISVHHNQRLLSPSGGRALVGFSGRVGDVLGCVHTLGVLESYRPAELDIMSSLVDVPVPQRFLWSSQSVNIPASGFRTTSIGDMPIWDHPFVSMHPPAKESFEDSHGEDLTAEMIPMQCIFYDRHDVVGLDVMEMPDGHSTGANREIVRYNTAIIGIRVRLAHGASHELTVTGGPPSSAQYNKIHGENVQGWDSVEYVRHFDIDGPGGEYIDLLAAEISQGLKAIKFRTNKGREIVVGSGSGNSAWFTQDFSGSESQMVGFVCGYGTRRGFKWGPDQERIYTLASLTCITALHAKRGALRSP